ncbi:hypothetical protein ANCCAN_08181 [Ancylostoma caninum]|uniref:Uncharacterized protein n=1 Tax=Ancylostoma caninum TaxID=29170 RepID=A0A368GN48_ANCCA|nr:hypothetical protein ANCCAN_08181 [Ancylostoma caninum]
MSFGVWQSEHMKTPKKIRRWELSIRFATVKELTENTRSAIHNLAHCNAPGRSGAHGVSAPLGANAKLAYRADRGNVLVSLAVTA